MADNDELNAADLELIGQAMIDTEKEIAASAWDKEDEITHDDTGDRTLEATGDGLEGQIEDDEEEGEEEGEAEGDGENAEAGDKGDGKDGKTAKPEGEGSNKSKPEGDAEKPTGRVPPAEHRKVAERARAAEAERDTLKAQLDKATKDAETDRTKSRSEIDELKGQFNTLQQLLQRVVQPQQKADDKAETPPNLFEDPDAWQARRDKELNDKLAPINQGMGNLRVELSMQIAQAVKGETFTTAFNALKSLNPRDPEAQITVRRIMSSDNPGQAVIDWHKQVETLREVGNDPAKYKERIRAEAIEALKNDPEFRKSLVEGMRDEAMTGNNGKPRTAFRPPPSLNGIPGNGASGESHIVTDNPTADFLSAFS